MHAWIKVWGWVEWVVIIILKSKSVQITHQMELSLALFMSTVIYNNNVTYFKGLPVQSEQTAQVKLKVICAPVDPSVCREVADE